MIDVRFGMWWRETHSLTLNLLSSFIHYLQKLEITQMTCSWWMDKWNLVYPSSEILLTNKKEQKLPPPQKKGNKLLTMSTTRMLLGSSILSERRQTPKLHSAGFSLCELIFWERQNYRDKKQISDWGGIGEFWGAVNGTALYLGCDNDYMLYQNSQNYTPESVNSPVCELHTLKQILKENLLRLSG